ncbi:MAG: ribbon-helix-helix protein, CopG family [Myxococcales bacterium]|nr:ribbon-helix-helix protein, CopG family [Myxococcales bacterium]
MAKQGISLRIESDQIDELDHLAKVSKRDRSFIITEAIEAYLEITRWQRKHIIASMAQADRGEFASAKEVAKALKKWG